MGIGWNATAADATGHEFVREPIGRLAPTAFGYPIAQSVEGTAQGGEFLRWSRRILQNGDMKKCAIIVYAMLNNILNYSLFVMQTMCCQ